MVHLQKTVGDLLEINVCIISLRNCAVSMPYYALYLPQSMSGPVVDATAPAHRRRPLLARNFFRLAVAAQARSPSDPPWTIVGPFWRTDGPPVHPATGSNPTPCVATRSFAP